MKCIVCGNEFHSPGSGNLVSICSRCVLGNTTLKKPRKEKPENYEDIETLRVLFPEFDIVERIGAGGMGAVFKANQKSLDRFVAIKVLNPELEGDPEFEERFQREAKAMALLNHPNIVGIHDFGVRGELHYLLMEYVDGQDLQKVIKAGDIEPEYAFSIIRQLCSALHFAHKKGVVHRDIKPGNILINKEGVAKIGDFGLARMTLLNLSVGLTMTESGMGTPAYVAPEQIEDAGSIDSRADIYALGVVVYEMLTGQTPSGNFPLPTSRFPRRNKRIDETILKAMERDPDDRIADVRKIAECLENLQSKTSEPSSKSSKAGRWVLSLLAVIMAVSAAWLVWPKTKPGGGESEAALPPSTNTDIEQLLPPMLDFATPEFKLIRRKGGILRKWEENPGLADVTAANGINDLIAVRGMRTTAASWSAARSNGEMISVVPTWSKRNDYVMVQTSFWIESPNRLFSLEQNEPKFLPLLKPVKRAVDIAQTDNVAVIVTPDGRAELAADNRWIKSHQFVIDRISPLKDVILADSTGQLLGVLTASGKPHVWHETFGFLDPPETDKRMVQLELGGNHALGLYEDGTWVTWTHKRNENSNHERLRLAMEQPTIDEPIICIEAFDFVNAVQRPDGSWFSWGCDQKRGLINQINSMGVALDMELFSMNLAGAKMVWIEPVK